MSQTNSQGALQQSNTETAFNLPMELFRHLACMVRHIEHVPCVAVADWPTRAARAMLIPDVPSAAIVAVLELAPRARAWQASHAGAAASIATEGLDRLMCDATRLTLPHWPQAQFPVDQPASQSPLFANLENGRGSVIQCGHRLNDHRALIAHVWHPAASSSAARVAKVEAAFELLAVKAACAFGSNAPVAWLSERETKVLDLLADGLTVAEIAEHLERSSFTVHDQVKNLYRKVGVHNRTSLARLYSGDHRDTEPTMPPPPDESPAHADQSIPLHQAIKSARPLPSPLASA